jgi:hypothetical protein
LRFAVRADSQPSEEFCGGVSSLVVGGGCINFPVGCRSSAIRESQMTAIVPPDLGLAAPLHPEPVE